MIDCAEIGVFYPVESSTFFDWYFKNTYPPLAATVGTYNELDAFVTSTHLKKIVCLQVHNVFHPEHDELIQQVYDHADSILICCSEIHASTIDFVRRNDRQKIAFFFCGFLNFELEHATYFPTLDWFAPTVKFYKETRPETLDVLRPYDTKPLYYDALLGRKKLHRECAKNCLKMFMPDQGILTYFEDQDSSFKDDTAANWIWESAGLELTHDVKWTADTVRYYGHEIRLSSIIPIEIYNQTAYTLIPETSHDSGHVLLSEKVVKPILARRLFVLTGCKYSLQKLKDIGFLTFDSIIDESYDTLEDPLARTRAAVQQLKYLCTMPQQQVFDQCKPILEHNFNHMISTDWYSEYFKRPFNNFFGINR